MSTAVYYLNQDINLIPYVHDYLAYKIAWLVQSIAVVERQENKVKPFSSNNFILGPPPTEFLLLAFYLHSTWCCQTVNTFIFMLLLGYGRTLLGRTQDERGAFTGVKKWS